MIGKRIASLAVAAGLAASQVALFAASAEASDRRYRYQGHQRPYATYGYAHRPYAPVRTHRDRTGDAVGAAILGIGALIVGAAIADSARKKRYYGYDD